MAACCRKVQARTDVICQRVLKNGGVVQLVKEQPFAAGLTRVRCAPRSQTRQADIAGSGFAVAETDCLLRKGTDG